MQICDSKKGLVTQTDCLLFIVGALQCRRTGHRHRNVDWDPEPRDLLEARDRGGQQSGPGTRRSNTEPAEPQHRPLASVKNK